jgi:flagellar motor switch protein FliM
MSDAESLKDARDEALKDEPAEEGTRERRVRTVDFSQPTKFGPELRRRIVRALGPFCEAFAIRLSSELRVSVELAVVDSQQLTWSAAKARSPADAVAVALAVAPNDAQMLLNIDPSMILRALDCLLGGSASQAPRERRLSEVDWALTRPLLDAMANQLTAAWREIGGLGFALGEVDEEGDAGVVVPLGEPTFAVTFSNMIDGLPASMSLLIPWSAVEPVADDIIGASAKRADADPSDGRAVRRGLSAASVLLRAEVGSTQIPVERILALAPGSVLELDDRAEDGVRVFAERVPLGRAHPGLRGTQRAVKLTTPIEPGNVPASALAAMPQAGRLHVRSALINDPGPPPEAGGDAPAGDPDDVRAAADPRSGVDRRSVPRDGEDRRGAQRMMGVSVRVWAELGRAKLSLGSALQLPLGTVLTLDQDAEAPIRLFANGKCFAEGALQVSGEGRWAVEIQALA